MTWQIQENALLSTSLTATGLFISSFCLCAGGADINVPVCEIKGHRFDDSRCAPSERND